jgi:ankyrin repeat protein
MLLNPKGQDARRGMRAAFNAVLHRDARILLTYVEWDPGLLDARHPALGHTLLTSAAMHGHAGAVKGLLELGAPIDVPGREGLTALETACLHSHIHVMCLLIRQGASLGSLSGTRPAAGS